MSTIQRVNDIVEKNIPSTGGQASLLRPVPSTSFGRHANVSEVVEIDPTRIGGEGQPPPDASLYIMTHENFMKLPPSEQQYLLSNGFEPREIHLRTETGGSVVQAAAFYVVQYIDANGETHYVPLGQLLRQDQYCDGAAYICTLPGSGEPVAAPQEMPQVMLK